LKEQYPIQEDMYSKVFGFEIGGNEFKTSQIDRGPAGIRLTHANGKYVAQLKVDGFTFSRLAPYETWEAIRAEACEMWGKYREFVSPEKVTRVAVRFINVMPLPLAMKDFDDYLTASPRVPAALPQAIASFFSRVVIPDEAIGAVAVVTQALETITEDKVPIVLDIDTFREFQEPSGSNVVWQTLDQLREFKNRIFFESITERTADLFT
jgi:uncharacterized protein (TIGR04255 family)